MKKTQPKTKEKRVRIGISIVNSEDFRHYLALSRESYPMGLGRLAAMCIDSLISDKQYYGVFELDRVVQWPSSHALRYAKILEQVGWARYHSQSVVQLTMPQSFMPKRAYKERAAFQQAQPQNSDGQFTVRTRAGKMIVLLDMDGYAFDEINEIEAKETPNAAKRARRRIRSIIPAG